VFSRVATFVRQTLAFWGVKVNDGNENTIMTTPHYGHITSKVASDYYRNYIIPQLATRSVWKNYIGSPYEFGEDPKGFLSNKKFRESMLVVFKSLGDGALPPNYQLLAQSLGMHGAELQGDGLMIQVGSVNGANAQVSVIDNAAKEQDARKATLAQIRGTKKTRGSILQEFGQRNGGLRNYTSLMSGGGGGGGGIGSELLRAQAMQAQAMQAQAAMPQLPPPVQMPVIPQPQQQQQQQQQSQYQPPMGEDY
jgi:hypothetical protein